jgi:hypothetical protein
MKRIVSGVSLMLLSCMLFLAFNSRLTIKANPETILYVSPSITIVNTGDVFSVNVSIQDVLDLYAFHLFLGYSTTVLDALSVYIYPPFNGGPIITIIDDEDGYVEVSGSIGIPGPGVFGSFPLAKITFNATTLGNSELHLYNIDLWDSMVNTIPHVTYNGSVKVTIPGDVDGDFKVKMDDIIALCYAFGSKIGQPKYHPNLDINNDGIISMDDIIIAVRNFGKHYP